MTARFTRQLPRIAGGHPPSPYRQGPAFFNGDSRWTNRIASLLVLTGIAIRLTQFLARRPLWLDEATLGIIVASRSAIGVLRPLVYHQAAPPLFLLIVRGLVASLGVNEWALRLLPFTAGIGFLLVIRSLSRRVVDPVASLWLISAVSVSPLLVYYGNEAKPYMVDALVGALLLLCLVKVLDDPDRKGAWKALAIAGVVSVWISVPAILIVVAAFGALLSSPRVRSSPRGVNRVVGVAVPGLLSFGLAFGMFYRRFADDEYLRHYWSSGFLDPRRGDFVHLAKEAMGGLVWSFFVTGPRFSAANVLMAIGGVVLAIGLASLIRRLGIWAGIALAGPLALSLLLSSFRRYPVVPRLMLFASAPLFLIAAEGVTWLSDRVPGRPGGVVLFAVLALSLFRPGRLTFRWAVHPPMIENSRPLITEIEKRRAAGEPIYVSARGAPAWLFYSTDWGMPDPKRLAWYIRRTDSGGPAFENAPSRGHSVLDEGDELVYHDPAKGDELLGIPTGMQSLASGFVTRDPDPGWARNEARRVRTAAHPTIWLFFSHIDHSQDKLFREIQDAGGRLIDRRLAEGAQIYRVEFPSEGGAPSARSPRSRGRS